MMAEGDPILTPLTAVETTDQRNRDYIDTFSTEAGQRVLQDLMEQTGVMRPAHVTGDPYESAYMEGHRQVVLSILDKLGRALTPEDFKQRVY